MGGTATLVLHATCVAFGNRGLLVIGPSGSGKSGLALELMAMGAALVADDRVALRRDGDSVMACAPPGLPALIEARGIGLLHAVPTAPAAPVVLVADLGQTEGARLPPDRRIELCGVDLPLLHKIENRHFPAAIRLYLLSRREE